MDLRSIGGGLPVGFNTLYKVSSAARMVPAQAIAIPSRVSPRIICGARCDHLISSMSVSPATDATAPPAAKQPRIGSHKMLPKTLSERSHPAAYTGLGDLAELLGMVIRRVTYHPESR